MDVEGRRKSRRRRKEGTLRKFSEEEYEGRGTQETLEEGSKDEGEMIRIFLGQGRRRRKKENKEKLKF